ncbi:uncharacterized protein LOC130631783 isoform X1 [Hydractinia symbiolongicarpus]|uniref:uncharacterized protein LOC130631783 isoform X1 n=1 Tax=Hydractinia symbiolongicarpus TaxID=13093 RepID=UPI00254C26AF|nr:uncharacterized protein LOC130631783 isoform X1 [Hydractinia symbiolongicarpus]
MAEEESVDLMTWLLSIFREVLCNGLDHSNCLSCQHVFSYVWDNFNKSYSHRDITRSIKLNFPSSKKLQIGDEEKTRIFCGLGFQTDNKTNCKPSDIAGRILCCFELWKQARDNEVKEKLKREMQQLVFHNPGPSTKDLLGFKPEFSNRERRKLNRLLGDKSSNQGKRGKKTKKATLHDNNGCLKSTGQDLCDCMIADCPGCHYPCPQCNSEKCGSTCRCDRKWTYDLVVYDTK